MEKTRSHIFFYVWRSHTNTSFILIRWRFDEALSIYIVRTKQPPDCLWIRINTRWYYFHFNSMGKLSTNAYVDETEMSAAVWIYRQNTKHPINYFLYLSIESAKWFDLHQYKCSTKSLPITQAHTNTRHKCLQRKFQNEIHDISAYICNDIYLSSRCIFYSCFRSRAIIPNVMHVVVRKKWSWQKLN